ncbi:hypothetical protein GQ53DRAFT_471920 [Thozetella sp. PMI_491]|nr:hypothetical protein GQ53DRAFT_471920 [Thozetella sp. PMI_491]
MLPRVARPGFRISVFRTPLARLPTASPAAAVRLYTGLESPAAALRRSVTVFSRAGFRSAAQRRFYYDPADPRLRNAKPLFWSWQTPRRVLRQPGTRTVAFFAVLAAAAFFFANLETVPISGRTRFNCFSADIIRVIGEAQYEKVLEEIKKSGTRILPSWDLRTRRVQRVMSRLIPFSGMVDEEWEIFVIEDPNTQNAFVLPGGKVFVFTGLLPVARNDAGLATVLGHEIAHNVADHTGERLSSNIGSNILMWSLIPLTLVIGVMPFLVPLLGYRLLDLAFAMPMSRRQESEADFIGLMMMAQACYDPREALTFWARMDQLRNMEVPEWISTHPSNESRIKNIQEWLPKAVEMAEQSDCSSTHSYADMFREALRKGHIITL